MPISPLAEIFGYPNDNLSSAAERIRKNRWCPFNNKGPSCTKDKANSPIGVCSIFADDETVITCPVRFREDWLIAEDAARFLFGLESSWTTLPEVRLTDRYGKTAGNIDLVIVKYDNHGHVVDFGSVEVQAVYISGNVRKPFELYIADREEYRKHNWSGANWPRPDYLSSSRKRLVPQMLYKGGILKAWGKRQVVALQTCFFSTLPQLKEVQADEADIAWMLYDLELGSDRERFKLKRDRIVYTEFQPALDTITTTKPGSVDDFVNILQQKLDEKLEKIPPDASTPDQLSAP